MIIPDWASPYFYIADEELHENFSYNDRRIFHDRKKSFKAEYESIIDWAHLSSLEIEERVRNYILCCLALGSIDQAQASLLISQGKYANDGTNRQHWIPECYLKEFSENGKIRKIDTDYFHGPSLARTDHNRLISIKSSDFCETPQEKGLLYAPLLEITLSKIEGDYSALDKSGQPVQNLWDFIVLSVFFLVFHLRTKQQLLWGHPAWNSKESLLIVSIPQYVSELNVVFYNIELSGLNPNEKCLLPFNQHPLVIEALPDEQGFSMWCVYTPTIFLGFIHKNAHHIDTGNFDFMLFRLGQTIGNKASKYLYYHPRSEIWRIAPEEYS